MGWIEMNEKTKKAQKTKAASLADRYSFGHKALSVVLSVVLLGFGWPAVNPAEVFANNDSAAQSEVAQTQESATAATDVSAAQPAESASSEQAVEASSANRAADANTAASTSAAAASEQPATQPSQPSANKAASADASAQVKSEYDIALELNNASIKKADGTDAVISLPATKVTVPAGNDFKFTVVPDNGYKLNRVLVNVGGQQSPLAADDAGVYTIEASAFEAGVTITLETEKDAVTASVENAVSIDEPVTQESNAAKAVSDGPISGPNVVAQGDSITLTYNGDMKIDNWYGGDGLFSGWEVSADKKTLKLTATSNWAFNGSSKTTTISLGYIDGQGVWHNQGDDCFKFNVTVKKRSFTVVQPAAKSVGDDCFWLPQIKDNETGKIIDLMSEAPSGSFYPFEYYRDGVKLNASQYWHNPDDFKQPGNYTVKIRPNGGWIYDFGDQSEIVVPIPTQKRDDETFEKWIYVGESKTYSGASSRWSSYSNWWINGEDKGFISFNKNGDSVTVTGESQGDVTLVHGYYKGWNDWKTETFTIHVLPKAPISELEITGPDTVEQFKNIILKTNADTDVTWTSSDPSIATIDANGKVTGVTEGKITVTAVTTTAEGKVLTATHEVTVTKSTAQTTSAKLFFLKSPTSNPDSNSAGDWFPTGGSSDLNVKVNVDGAAFSGKNTWDNVANRVVSWPDGSTGTTWTLPRANSYWSQVFNNYKNEIQNKLHVSITEDDVEAIILHPYKISKNGSSYHLDCKVEIKVKQVVTATFWIQSPGATGFDKEHSVSTLEVKDGVAQVVAPEAPEAEKTVNGTKYKFMGWYSDQACTQAVTFPITTSENVFYYGKYVPCDQSIQVNYYLEGTTKPVAPSKTLTGYMKGQTVTQEPIAISGYTPVSGEAKMGVVGTDASIDFYYTANTVNYKVEYYWNGSDKPFETVKASGKCGDTISDIAPKSFSGYTAVSNGAKSLTLSGDEDKNVVKFYYYKNVTLTANSDTKTYNGSEQSVDGYTTNLPEGTTASFDGVTLNGGKGTNAGDYAYTFADGTMGKVSTDNNYIVTEVTPGNLHISPVNNEVTITIAGHKGGEKYNGEEQTVEGYDVSGLPSGVSKDDIASNGSAEVKATDAGTYPVNLNEKQFSLTGDAAKNYTNVKFVVTDGELKIDKRAVTLTSEDGHKNYDGKTLQRRTNLKVGGDGFVGNDGVLAKDKLTWYDENNILPGTYENKFEPAYTEGTNLDNYDVKLEFGKLVVNARSDKDKYQITVTAKSDTKPYNGNVYTVSGVADTTFTNDKGATFTVEGLSASVSATDAGEYDNKVVGTAVVKDAQGNDVTSQFNVTTVDGKLIINKRNVVLVSESHGFTYDGLDHDWQKVNVDPNSDGFVNGESVTYKDFASIKDVGTKDNSFDFEWSNAKEQNYNITKRYGSLAVSAGDINKYVTLNTTDVEETYNGEHHIAGEATAIDANGNNLVIEYQKSDGNWTTDRNEVYAVNVGEYGIVNVRVSSPANYGEGSYVTGTEKLVVKAVDIELTAKSDNRPYSGTALTNNGYDITNGAFVGDEGLSSVTVSGSQLEVGSSSNEIAAYGLKGNTKAENYNITTKPGTLEVTASHAVVVVKIEGNKDSQKYNGSEQSVSGYEVTGVTVDGQESTLYPAAETDFTFSGTATAARTDAGTTQMGLSAEQFKNANKNFSNVTFEVEDGSMTVTKRAVTLTSATDKKTYDGDALTNDTVTVSGDGFVDGQGFTANVTGSQTDAGSSDNTFTYELTGGATEGENGNYTIAKSEGKLTVDPITAPVTVTIVGKTEIGTYDGKELTAEGYTFTSDNAYYTQDKVAFSGDSEVVRTDAGKTEMGLPGKFANADTTNFTNVTFNVTDGYVDISKVVVTLKSADLTKRYDGTALTNKNGGESETPLEISGFAEGEGATYTFTGSQTVVGSSANAFSYTLNENTKADNYNITKTEGTLTVTNRDAKYQIKVKANSATATYDGKQHSATGIETNEFKVEGNTYTVSGLTTEDPVKTNAGTYPNNITGTAVVTDADGNDVSDQFEVTTENGSLVIDKATVTMKSASDEWTYDGNEHTKHDMESVEGFAEGEGATFAYTGAITNVGEKKNTYTYTLNANTSADNYTFAEPEYGTLKVNPVTDKVTVTIKGKQDTKSYNGSTQFVTGYEFSTKNSLYAQTNVKFTGDATAKGIAVGGYNMNLAKEQFSNTNKNFSNVEFVVEDGWLKIEGGEIDQNGVVWNTHDNQKAYDGTPLAAYTATATDKYGNALNVEYSIDGETWTSDPSQITITHFGFQAVQLRATGSNYAEGQYATSFESIAITKRLVTLTSEGGNKPYDGTPLTNGTVTATAKGEGVGFIDGEGVSFNVTGSQTEKGESDNTFDYTFNEGTSEADYWVTTKCGKLIVTADENEVVVTITENGGNVEYDGTEKSVSGYEFSASNELYKKSDFTFSGNDTVKGTNVGTYDMELKPSDFTNNNQNFSKVTFVIVDGQLNITPKSIETGKNMSVEALADVVYNGQPQLQKPVVKDGEKTLVEGTDYTLSYEGDTTNVGTVKVVVTGIGNYAGTTDVTYKITQRSVTLTSVTDSKPYDGTALTRPNVTATGDGFVDGEVTNVRATGSVTTVAEGEVTNAIAYDDGVNFKASNYDITKKEGKLSITALSAEDGLVITPKNAEYTYNAESHSAGLASASASVDGTNVSIEYRVEGSPDAEWRSNPSVITAINAGTVTIEVRASADNYSGYKYAKQTLTIKKRDVELTSASATKVYDGTALTKDWVDMGPNRADTGFIWTDLADDGQVHATGSQTVVGKSENTISYELKAGAASNYNIIGEHLGTLEVTKQSIVPDPKNPESYTGATISNPSDSVYNGEEHKWAPEVKDAKGNVLVEGTDYTVSYDTDNFTDAKTIKVIVTGIGNYTGTATKTYKITPAPLKVIANSASKPYDGKPLTAGGVIEGLVDGETATAQTEGSQTEVGSSVNTAKESIEWGTATNKDNYYIQSLTDGKLTVTAKSITASDITVGALPDVVYSGTEQAQKPEVKDGDTALVEGTDYDLDFSEDKTNVGTVTVVVTGKGNYAGEVTRTYQIVPAKLTVTTPSASKVYNGNALTAEGAISGFVNGETAAFTTTGSQTEVGSSTNTYAIDWTGAAKQGNYTISENLGTLTVTETTDEIIATPGNYNGTYDGQTHGVDVTVTGLPEGYSVKTAASYATATDVTDGVIANVDELVIVNAQGEDVTANLKITKDTGTIKITPATLKVTTYGAKAEYNGNALTADGEVTGFVNNEAAAFTTTGSQTEVGSSTNTYDIDWSDTAKQSNYTVEEHLGTLEVTKNMAAIMVIPQGASKPYDGTALTSAGVTTYGLPAGYTLTATTKGSVTNVGGATAEVDTYSIKDAAGEDVTDQFGNVFTGKATLQVTKRPVTVASASASKVYDGIALTKHEASVTDGSLATGESFSYDFSGEQTTVGSTSNAYAIKAGANTDLDNYEITKANGTLTVTAQSINPTDPTPGAYTGVEVDSPSDVTYDANEHKWVPTVIDKDKNKLIEGTDYDVTYSTGDFTNVTGSIKVTIVGKGNYTGTVIRTYQITPASVALSSNSHEFTYTGEPQGDAAVNASGAAELFQSQVNDLKATGSVTNVGDVAENSISYNWNDGFTADNYNIETSFGELSVVAKNIDTGKDMSVNDPVNVTYNGGDQTWAPTVNDGEKTLVGGSDYTVSYSTDDRTNVTGVITVTIMGKGNYTGAIEKNYQVLPKGYSVTTATGSKPYDGKPLKGSELEGNAVDGLVDGSDAAFTVTGSQTEVGGDAKNNTYKLTFSSEQMAKNYTLASEQLGTLTVTENADEIVVTTTGGEFTYSGQAHGATVSVSELPEGYTLEKAESSATATDVTTDDVIADADTLVIKNAQGEDVTNKLNIKKIPGTIKVTPATLTVTTYGAEAEYNGNALTADGTIEGFVNNETATFATTGSQTYVGESDNTYSIAWDGTAKERNYTVVPIIGKLKVTDDIDNSEVINKGHESGTYDLGATVNFAITAKNVYDTPQTMTISEIDGVTLDQSVFKNVAPGASIEAHATYTITEADLLAGTFVNTATVTFGNGKSYKNTDEVDVAKLNAHLSVVKATTSTPANGSAYQLGETIKYAVTVTNDGNLTANDVAVSDGLAGVQLAEGQNANVGTLAPGASATVNFVYTVTEADVLAGNVRNSATATGAPNGGGTLDVTPGTTTDPTGPAAGHITVVKTTTSTPENGKAYQLGEKIVYSIRVVNDGNLTVSNVKVSDANADNFGEKVIESLAPGASEDFEATHTVTEADVLAGTVTNVATAKGTSPDPNAPEVPVTPGTKDEPTDTPNAHITIVKHAEQNGSGEAGAFKLGETIEYAITVTNTGNLTATDVKVSDANADNFGEKVIESLEPGASETFTASHTVTEADVLAGKVNNVATAKGASPDPNAPEVPVTPGEDTKIVDPVNTTLTVAKQAAAPANGEAYQLGEEVAYTISVTNSGNVAYSNVKVSDAQTGLNEVIGTLAVGETKTYEAKHVITEQDIVAGVYVNTATAKADPIVDGNGTSHTPQGEATETIGANTDKPLVPGSANLAAEKVVTNEGTGESGAFKLGDTIEYKITVTNNGTLTAKGFKVIDNNADGFEPVTIDELAPGATTDAISAKHVVTSDDILAGSVFNVATTAGGTTPDPKVDPEPTPGENDQPVDAVNATLNVEKTAAASASGSYKLGEGVVYTIKVTNNGNVPYKNVKVADGQTGLNETIDTLAVGETRTFTTTHVVDEADIIAGSYTNVATATADPIHDPKTGADVTPQGSDDETIGANTDRPIEPSNPALRITKTSDVAAGTLLKEGDAVTYTVTVENTGNLTLTNVKATDSLAGATLAPGQSDTRAELAPGEQFSVNYVYEVTQADVVAGSVHNEATASGVSPDPNKPVDPGAPGTKDDPTETAKPSLSIQKSNNGSADVAAGSTVSYTITAINNGNVDLTGVVVTDELTGFTSDAFDLGKGESRTFDTSYTVQESDIVNGSIVNVAKGEGSDPKGGMVTGEGSATTTTEAMNGALSVEKKAEAGVYGTGDTVNYAIAVSNTGNVALSNVKVVDAKTGLDETCDLAVGETKTFTTSYAVTMEDVAAGTLANVATATGSDPKGNPVTGSDTETIGNTPQPNPSEPGSPSLKRAFEAQAPSDVVYNGASQQQKPVVKDGETMLSEGTDYELSYSADTTNAGTVTVTVKGKGNYEGSVDVTYQILKKAVKLVSSDLTKPYDGTPLVNGDVALATNDGFVDGQGVNLTFTGSRTDEGTTLQGNTFTWEAKPGTNLDNYAIEAAFGSLTVTPKSIVPGDANGMEVSAPSDKVYTGAEQKFVPVVTDGEKTLVEGVDYAVSYTGANGEAKADFTNVTGSITVTVTGMGNYAGSVARSYQITPKPYTVVTAGATKVYNGTGIVGADLEGSAVDGLVSDSDAAFVVTGEQPGVGSSTNTYKLTFSSEQMAKNYTLASEQLGTLTVTENADEIVVTTTGGEFTYSGQAHGATVSVSELPEGYTLEKAESSASATNVADGTVVATADTLVIRNAQGKDVTDELKIRKIDGEIQVTPAPLSIETGSATKTYDGSALTNATLKVDGLVAGDVVTGRTTGSQTEVGSSANTYTLTWGEVDPANYEITEQLGVLTVEAVVAPVIPGPQQPGGPVVVPPTTAEPAGPADVVADALEGAYETVTGDKATEEQIYDSENPLGKEQAAHCWVHWYMILVMILTALYGVAVWLRRGNHTRKLKNDMNNILGGGDDGKDPSGSPVATNHPAGMEA